LKKRKSKPWAWAEEPAAPAPRSEEAAPPPAAGAGEREPVVAPAELTAPDPAPLPTGPSPICGEEDRLEEQVPATDSRLPEPDLLTQPRTDLPIDGQADTSAAQSLPLPEPMLEEATPPSGLNPPVAVLAAPVATIVPDLPLAEPARQALEERVRRLEEALDRLQAGSARPPAPAEQVRREKPAPPSPTNLLLNLGKRLLQPSEPKPPTPTADPAPPPAAAASPAPPAPTPPARRWLLSELLAEARAIFRMFVDPRYRLSWFGRVVPLVLAVAIVTSWWWVPGTSILIFGTILDKAVDLLLAFVLFKVLAHEARRYRESSPDLPPSLRLRGGP
jgi:hypothetical protein